MATATPALGEVYETGWGRYTVLDADESRVKYRFRALGGREREAAMPAAAFRRLIKAAGCAPKTESE